MGHKSDELAKGFSLPAIPKRTEIPEEAALRFLQGKQAEKVVSAPRPSRLRRAGNGQRVAISLPPDAAVALRIRCAQERRSVSDAVTEVVTVWLRSSKPGGLDP